MRYILTTIVFVTIFFNINVFAYSDTTMSVNPNPPQPGSEVTVEVNNFATNLQTHNITWYVNDKLHKSGVGTTKIKIILPTGGANVRAVITGVSDTTVNIHPIYVDILWEAQTITPSWYKGRALPTDSSKITAVAYPHTEKTSELIYKWYKNGILLDITGVNNTLVTEAPDLYDSYLLSVEVLDNTGAIVGSNGVTIKTTFPEIVLYKKMPLLGLNHNMSLLYDNTLNDIENTIVAVPFYFNTGAKLTYKWNTRNLKAKRQTNDSILINKIFTGATLGVEINNPNVLLQNANKNINLLGHVNMQNNESGNESPFGTAN